MTHDEFNAILDARIDRIQSTLAGKAKEYATEDRLHNFKQAATVLRCSPEAALRGMWIKHLISLLDIWETPWSDAWEEKLGDCINYLLLLEGIKRETGAAPESSVDAHVRRELQTRHAPASEKSVADACVLLPSVVRRVLQAHPDLYQQDTEGNWSLRK